MNTLKRLPLWCAATALCLTLLPGCGQKGPLHFPKDKAAAMLPQQQ